MWKDCLFPQWEKCSEEWRNEQKRVKINIQNVKMTYCSSLAFPKNFPIVLDIIIYEVMITMGNEGQKEQHAQKDGENMPATKTLYTQENALAEGMKRYIVKLIREGEQTPAKTKAEAIEALKRTGVLSEDGNEKDKIVSWE